MPGAPDPLYVQARKALLDATGALAAPVMFRGGGVPAVLEVLSDGRW